MKDIYIQKESEKEYSIFLEGISIGSYFIGVGLVLNNTEGNVVTLTNLENLVSALWKIELDSRSKVL